MGNQIHEEDNNKNLKSQLDKLRSLSAHAHEIAQAWKALYTYCEMAIS